MFLFLINLFLCIISVKRLHFWKKKKTKLVYPKAFLLLILHFILFSDIFTEIQFTCHKIHQSVKFNGF